MCRRNKSGHKEYTGEPAEEIQSVHGGKRQQISPWVSNHRTTNDKRRWPELTAIPAIAKLNSAQMTTANKISIFRILLIPVFVVELLYYLENGREWHRYAALAAFLGAAVSDGIDGYIARRYNQSTELGAILDPLADKLLMVSSILLVSFHQSAHLPRLPLWLPVTVISRDLIILAGMIVINHVCGKTKVRPHWIGKVATVLQIVAVAWALFKWDARWLFGWSLAAAVCTGASGVIYILSGVNQLSTSPASAPAAKP